ncbi:N5-glutamine S-adenosyl-L-methionine-dependent methyltransferase [Pigmentiphaga humi]|uniref:N5-glutamine S-adenosyl-L-methionine-dependent methyltransferase n=1 Tax=Pigmentiphaga humi TaxID=2478468 RepID=A0A3P4B437_9BURK|nr:class I SAM-dependent methyltransferase [Pigmentiphaga humi]VCU70398.1 N5-glutamine S-adenosyl-L-methionine-dependent methyltransferase [Pigmentiphaga humi]
MTTAPELLRWNDPGPREAAWLSSSGHPPPKRMLVADDRMPADQAYRHACEGTALLWQGDFQNARQLLQAMARRVDRKPVKPGANLTETFHLYRQAQLQRARVLGMLLVPLAADGSVPLRRAPDVRQACLEAYGPQTRDAVVSLRELQGAIGAHEWRKKGVPIAALDARIHPHYGVFSPVRGEYVELVAQAPLPSAGTAFDIGTGTGVLAAVLARRGMRKVVATDNDPRALACARDNIARLGLTGKVRVEQTDLFPAGRAALAVCNPPWLPGSAHAGLDRAIFDPSSRMLRGFLAGLAEHLEPGGEGWLILSDLAEHLGLRTREELLDLIAQAGLRVAGRHDVKPRHPRAQDDADPLHAARAAETTTLWRLVPAAPIPSYPGQA